MKIHEIQEQKGFVDIAKWLNISHFFVIELLSNEKTVLNV